MWSIPDVAEVATHFRFEESSSDVGDILRVVFNQLGMSASLKEVGISKDKFEELVINSLNDPFIKTNPISITRKERVIEILEMVA